MSATIALGTPRALGDLEVFHRLVALGVLERALDALGGSVVEDLVEEVACGFLDLPTHGIQAKPNELRSVSRCTFKTLD